MYRNSSDYRFVSADRSLLHRSNQYRPSPSGSKLNYYPPPNRRGSINDLIGKFEQPPVQQYRSQSQAEIKLPFKYSRQTSGGSSTADDMSTYDNVYYDTTDSEVIEEVRRDDETVARGLLMRALIPIWLLIRPILETITIAPLPLFFSFTGTGIFALLVTFIMPRSISQMFLYPAFRLICGTLYPAYASYKAVRTKNVKEYVKWMMYWIVFAFFTCIETFTDIFLSWFPFYYEIKTILVVWLLSPATKGSSTLYRKFVHPQLTKREDEIDEYINQAKEKGYTAIYQLGSKGVNYATNIIMQTAIKGGGGLVQSIRRSYSLSDLSEPDSARSQDDIDVVMRPRRIVRNKNTLSMPSGRPNVDMSFPELDLQMKHRTDSVGSYNYIRSTDDVSSGYSSAEPGLSRAASITSGIKGRPRSKNRSEDEEDDPYESYHPVSTVLSSSGGQEVIFARYDPSIESYVYFSDKPRFIDENVSLVRPTVSYPRDCSLEVLPSVDEEDYHPEDNRENPLQIKDKTYQQFLEWLEEQKRVKEEVDDDKKRIKDQNLTNSSKNETFIEKMPEKAPVKTAENFSENIQPKIVSTSCVEETISPIHAPLAQQESVEHGIREDSPDEFKDVIEDDEVDSPVSEDESEHSVPTVKENPYYLQSLLVKNLEKFAESLPKIEKIEPKSQETDPKIIQTLEEKLPLKPQEENVTLKNFNEKLSVKPLEEKLSLKTLNDNSSPQSLTEKLPSRSLTEVLPLKSQDEKLSLKPQVENSSSKTMEENLSLKTIEPILKEVNGDPGTEVAITETLINVDQDEGSSSNDSDDTDIVLESKLTISNSHVELTTLKTRTPSQSSLNRLTPKEPEVVQYPSAFAGSPASLSVLRAKSNSSSSLNQLSVSNENLAKRPATHSKGKAPLAPPLPPRTHNPSPPTIIQLKPPIPKTSATSSSESLSQDKKSGKKQKLFASLAGMFKSEPSASSSKDNSKINDPRETRI